MNVERAHLPWAHSHAKEAVRGDPENLDKARRLLSLEERCEAAGFDSAALSAADDVRAMLPAIRAGDGGKVLDAIALCMFHRLGVPLWLEDEYLRRYGAVTSGFARDWNDPRAFGPAYPKGTNRAGIRAKVNDAPAAYRIACELLGADPQLPIDRALYEAIGERVGVGKTQAEKLVKMYLAEDGDYEPPLRWLRDRLAAGQALEAARREWRDARSEERHERWLREQGYAPDAAGVWSKPDPGK